MQSTLARLMVVGSLAALLGGCTFLVEGQEEGRPCRDGRCPFGFVCVDDRCVRPNDAQENGEQCTVATDCVCEHGATPACGVDEICRCISMQGSMGGVGDANGGGRFGVVGGRLGTAACGTGSDPSLTLCGGITQ